MAAGSVVRRRLPAANELVYDYRSFFVIGYSPTHRPTKLIVRSVGSKQMPRRRPAK